MTLNLLHHELENAAATWRHRIAIVTPNSTYSFQQFDQKASALAGALVIVKLTTI